LETGGIVFSDPGPTTVSQVAKSTVESEQRMLQEFGSLYRGGEFHALVSFDPPLVPFDNPLGFHRLKAIFGPRRRDLVCLDLEISILFGIEVVAWKVGRRHIAWWFNLRLGLQSTVTECVHGTTDRRLPVLCNGGKNVR
jgi:hypothetical protein